jgi:hypothetical protein
MKDPVKDRLGWSEGQMVKSRELWHRIYLHFFLIFIRQIMGRILNNAIRAIWWIIISDSSKFIIFWGKSMGCKTMQWANETLSRTSIKSEFVNCVFWMKLMQIVQFEASTSVFPRSMFLTFFILIPCAILSQKQWEHDSKKVYSFPKSIYNYVHFGIILITNRGLYFWEFMSHLAESQIPPVGCVQKIEKHWIKMDLPYRTSFRPGIGGSVEINPLWNVQQIKWKPASTSCWAVL